MGTPAQNSAGVSFARADCQLGRSVLAVFALAAVVAVLGPLLSYRSDLAQLQDFFRLRVVHETDGDANTLERHLRLLQTELERLADRSEIDLLDSTFVPEQELLDSAHRNSTLFDSGVAIVDANGHPVWSMSADLKVSGQEHARWFDKLKASRTPVVDILDPAHRMFLVAVPVLRKGQLTGALVGFSRAIKGALAPGTPTDPLVRVIRDSRGQLSLPDQAPWWSLTQDFLGRLETLPGEEGAFRIQAGEELFASAALVGDSGITLIEVGNERQITNPVRYRFRLQMLLLLALQTGAVLLLSLFLRRTYIGFLAVERRALEQDRLLALGSAASLIAHEVKNSLNGLQAAASLLSTTGDASPDTALPVRSIRGEVDRLKHLASSLLLFGRPDVARRQPVALSDVVREVAEGIKVMPEAEEVALQLDVPRTLWVACDPFLLATAVHNLVRNAVEAAIEAKDLGRVKAPQVSVRVELRGDWVAILVEDNAGGVSPTVVERLFEPFVTGKPKGIGLGLSMTRRAMEAQGGTLAYERTATGSRFILRLPLPPVQEGTPATNEVAPGMAP